MPANGAIPNCPAILLQARERFPALRRTVAGRRAVYLDGPAGSQTPQSVPEAIADYLMNHNANHGGAFVTSRESDTILEAAGRAGADLVGGADPGEIIFGANMTTLTFAISRAIAQTWEAGDEIIVTRLDHDANVSPWVRAATDRNVIVKHVGIDPNDCTLDREEFLGHLSKRTKLVAVGAVSNAVGTRNPVKWMTEKAHDAGALVYVDAVHHTPHFKTDVNEWRCDFLACSAYKFFGPHIGFVWGRRKLWETLTPYKVRPCAETLPDRWMTGTQNFECIAGTLACIDYLASLGQGDSRRQRLVHTFATIETYEREMSHYIIRRLNELSSVRIRGITDHARMHERAPTLSFTHRRLKPRAVAEHLAEKGVFVWSGNYYALPLTEALGLEPDGMVRVGLLHYNSVEDVDRLIEALAEID